MLVKNKKYCQVCSIVLVLIALVALPGIAAAEPVDADQAISERLDQALILCIGSTRAYVNNVRTAVDKDDLGVYPVVKKGRTLVPARFIAENLGAKVTWDSKTSRIGIKTGSTVMELTLGSDELTVNGVVSKLDVPAQTVKGRTCIPLRAVVESFGKKVFNDGNLIIISNQENIIDPADERYLIEAILARFNELGNTQGNFNNGGGVAEKDGWIYYCTWGEDAGIFKMKSDGTGKIRLCRDGASDINVVGDWVFYINESDRSKIYKIGTDGTSRSPVSSFGGFGRLIIRGDWMYTFNTVGETMISKQLSFNKMRTDGTSYTTLFKFESDWGNTGPKLSGDWVYYIFENSLNRINTDNGAKEKLNVDANFDFVHMVQVEGDSVYYNDYEVDKLMKVNVDGSNKTVLAEIDSQFFNVVGGWVYFFDCWVDQTCYKIKTDGSEVVEIMNGEGMSELYMTSEWIIFSKTFIVSDGVATSSLYKMRLDGSEISPL